MIRGALNQQAVPQYPRYAVWDTYADTALSTIPALVNADKSGSTAALREGALGRVFGVDHYMSQSVVRHETAMELHRGVCLSEFGAKGAQTIHVKGSALTGRFLKGDLINIDGRTYTITEESAEADENAIRDVKIYPGLANDYDVEQQVLVLGNHTANLAFHPSAFAFVSRPLSAPAGVESYVTSYDGISLRVVRGYDMKHKREMLSMDVLYAYKTVYPEMAVRCLG